MSQFSTPSKQLPFKQTPKQELNEKYFAIMNRHFFEVIQMPHNGSISILGLNPKAQRHILG